MSIRSDLSEGRRLGAPFCCRLRFALEYALNPNAGQSLMRGVRLTRDGDEYVPCRVFHKTTFTHAEHEYLLNLPGGTISTRVHERGQRP
jgi:hypothetical protein